MKLSLRTGGGLAFILGVGVGGCYLGPSVDSPPEANMPGGDGADASQAAVSGSELGSTTGTSSTATSVLTNTAVSTVSSLGTSTAAGTSTSTRTQTSLGTGTAVGTSTSVGTDTSVGTSKSTDTHASTATDTSANTSTIISTDTNTSSVVCPNPPMDAGVDYDAAAKCSSGKTYTSGTGPTMEPGLSCYNCHGTQFTIVGTVYPTAHEPDTCDGANVKNASVTLTDAKKNVITLTPNAVGNFYSAETIVMPFTAVVSYNGKSIAMTTPQMNADCNSCHTQGGASCAPGRVVLP